MKDRQVVFYLLFFAFTVLTIACDLGALPIVSREKPPRVNISVTITQMPKILPRGENGTFSIKTDPQNSCWADIQYSDESGNRTAKNLPELEANQDGICTWVWTAPMKASKGTAWFSIRVGHQGETFMPIPSVFCIEQCPY